MRLAEFFTEKRKFHALTACALMERELATCRPADSGRSIASKLAELNIGSLPVVDEHGLLVGLVSEFDLLRVLMEGKDLRTVRAEEIMSRELKAVNEDTPVDEAIRLLETNHLIRVPVVKDGRLVGIVARRDILFGYIKCTDTFWWP